MKILVTGASGFVGQHLCRYLTQQGIAYRALTRRELRFEDANLNSTANEWYCVNYQDQQALIQSLEGITHIIHLAGRAHTFDAHQAAAEAAYRQDNVELTRCLVAACANMGIHFIYVSTIKVNGEQGIFTKDSLPDPQDYYAASKYAAEKIVQGIIGCSYTIIRPCVLYGPDVKGNISRLLSAVYRGLPLPIKGLNNQRSMMHIDNFCQLLVWSLTQDSVRQTVILAADTPPLSSTEIVYYLASGMHKPARLIYIPVGILHKICRLMGREADFLRLSQSLVVEGDSLKSLGFRADISLEQGLKQMASFYLKQKIDQ